MKPYIILDRDGTLIVEKNYLSDPAAVELLPGVAAGLSRIQAAGFVFVIITNQSGVGRGYFTLADVDACNQRLSELLMAAGVTVAGIYVCPHAPDEHCACRKPRTGLVDQAVRDLGFDPKLSWVIGDKPVDIDLARNLGARSILVCTGYGAEHAAAGSCAPDHIAADIPAAAEIICQYKEMPSSTTYLH